MPRLFIAIEPPEEIRAAVLALRGGVTHARWIHDDQVHLTVRFIGSVRDDEVAGIAARLREVRVDPFELRLSGVGVFPAHGSPANARVLWAGVSPHDSLRELKTRVDECIGPDPEAMRGFHPHLTLARFHTAPDPDLAEFLDRHSQFASDPWGVREVALFSSDTRPEGAVHTRLS